MGLYGNMFLKENNTCKVVEIENIFETVNSVAYQEYCNYKNLLSECVDEKEKSILEAKVEVLYEISVKDIWEKILGFFRKIKEFVVGMIKKIKDFFAGKKIKEQHEKIKYLEKLLNGERESHENLKKDYEDLNKKYEEEKEANKEDKFIRKEVEKENDKFRDENEKLKEENKNLKFDIEQLKRLADAASKCREDPHLLIYKYHTGVNWDFVAFIEKVYDIISDFRVSLSADGDSLNYSMKDKINPLLEELKDYKENCKWIKDEEFRNFVIKNSEYKNVNQDIILEFIRSKVKNEKPTLFWFVNSVDYFLKHAEQDIKNNFTLDQVNKYIDIFENKLNDIKTKIFNGDLDKALDSPTFILIRDCLSLLNTASHAIINNIEIMKIAMNKADIVANIADALKKNDKERDDKDMEELQKMVEKLEGYRKDIEHAKEKLNSL